MIQYVGYMIPVSQMKRWLFWIVSWLFRLRVAALTHVDPIVLYQPPLILYASAILQIFTV